MTASDVIAAVRRLYGREAVIVTKVSDKNGTGASRRMDAIAIGCWPSRGLYLHAIEVKVSRSDLKRELAVPEKADKIRLDWSNDPSYRPHGG